MPILGALINVPEGTPPSPYGSPVTQGLSPFLHFLHKGKADQRGEVPCLE